MRQRAQAEAGHLESRLKKLISLSSKRCDGGEADKGSKILLSHGFEHALHYYFTISVI